MNAIRAASKLAEQNTRDETQPIAVALQTIIDSDLKSFGSRVRRGIRINAKGAVLAMQANNKEAVTK